MGEERRPRGTGGEGRRHQVVHTILHLAQGGIYIQFVFVSGSRRYLYTICLYLAQGGSLTQFANPITPYVSQFYHTNVSYKLYDT